MKSMLIIYLLGFVLTLLSVFVRLMEALWGSSEIPLSGSSEIPRGPLAITEPPKGPPDGPSRGKQ
ncbi:hypoxia-inducible lipid droplet-associated protein-like [Acomys russatus]|uniref:hypoxia-inducible lipid droplet-associated protein-like n=1 Tax=Acomys russatus TaxID=60746 RepID=UPI0021E31A97|nr:hypoxia-inducible lipid droplet-associated protein-like [Acomys russatus]